jgi:hypothetical protein
MITPVTRQIDCGDTELLLKYVYQWQPNATIYTPNHVKKQAVYRYLLLIIPILPTFLLHLTLVIDFYIK